MNAVSSSFACSAAISVQALLSLLTSCPVPLLQLTTCNVITWTLEGESPVQELGQHSVGGSAASPRWFGGEEWVSASSESGHLRGSLGASYGMREQPRLSNKVPWTRVMILSARISKALCVLSAALTSGMFSALLALATGCASLSWNSCGISRGISRGLPTLEPCVSVCTEVTCATI